jgi:alpha-tubulin suppressor-like RCC1 family protein
MRRRRHHHGGEGGGGGGTGGANRILVAGYDEAGQLGLNAQLATQKNISWYEGVPVLTGIVQVCPTMALDGLGRVFSWGPPQNGALGNGAVLHKSGQLENDSLPGTFPVLLTGGLPLFREELLEGGKTSTMQPRGPIGPLLPPIAAIGGHANHRHLLCQDGRVLAFGANDGCELSNGWETRANFVEGVERAAAGLPSEPLLKKYSFFYQGAPWWVQTAGPPQTVQPGESNILKDIVMMAVGDECAVYVRNDGKIFQAGYLNTSNEIPLYCEEETLWTEANALAGGKSIVAIDCGKQLYIVLLSDGTVRIGRKGVEGVWGDGVELGSAIRQIHQPTIETSPGVFAPMTGVKAVACGEYAWLVLKTDNTVWACGSNGEGQLGLGLPLQEGEEGEEGAPERVFIKHPRQITSLGKTARAITMSGTIRGLGAFGGDIAVALLEDGKIKSWGMNHVQASKGARLAGTGAIADGTVDSKNVPTSPLDQPLTVNSIVGIDARPDHVALIQNKAAPRPPKLTVTRAGPSSILIVLRPDEGPLGQLPRQRAEESFDIIVASTERKETFRYKALPAGTRSVNTGTALYNGKPPLVLPPGVYEVTVIENVITELPLPLSKVLAIAGVAPVGWPAPTKAEPALLLEWRRERTYIESKGGKPGPRQEPFHRLILPGTALSTSITVAPTHAFPKIEPEEKLEVEVKGAFTGTFNGRQVSVRV